MSYYLKRMTVLKQVQPGFSITGKALSGLAKAEKTGANVKFTLSLLNIAKITEGDYYLAITGDGDNFCFFNIGTEGAEFSALAKPYIDIENGFACLVCFVYEPNIIPIAFGGNNKITSIESMKNSLSNYLAVPKNSDVLSVGQETPKIAQDEPKLELQREKLSYEDEIVATDNYYLYSDVDLENLSIEQDWQKGTKSADTPPEKEGLNDIISNISKGCDTDNNLGVYYDRVKAELDDLFKTNQKDTSLEDNIPDSKWVRIYYSDQNYYIVGIIYEDDAPSYICYGVPGKYSKEPPKELEGFCSYLPLSLFDLNGDGYWMMYQNAKTGECVHIDFL